LRLLLLLRLRLLLLRLFLLPDRIKLLFTIFILYTAKPYRRKAVQSLKFISRRLNAAINTLLKPSRPKHISKAKCRSISLSFSEFSRDQSQSHWGYMSYSASSDRFQCLILMLYLSLNVKTELPQVASFPLGPSDSSPNKLGEREWSNIVLTFEVSPSPNLLGEVPEGRRGSSWSNADSLAYCVRAEITSTQNYRQKSV